MRGVRLTDAAMVIAGGFLVVTAVLMYLGNRYWLVPFTAALPPAWLLQIMGLRAARQPIAALSAELPDVRQAFFERTAQRDYLCPWARRGRVRRRPSS